MQLVASLLLVVRPGAPSSVLAPSSNVLTHATKERQVTFSGKGSATLHECNAGHAFQLCCFFLSNSYL